MSQLALYISAEEAVSMRVGEDGEGRRAGKGRNSRLAADHALGRGVAAAPTAGGGEALGTMYSMISRSGLQHDDQSSQPPPTHTIPSIPGAQGGRTRQRAGRRFCRGPARAILNAPFAP